MVTMRGFDTETLNGYARIASTEEGFIEVNNIGDVLEFLTCRANRSCILWTWNLRYDAQALIKYLPKDQAMTLYVDNELYVDDYKLSYIQGKFLYVTYKNRKTKVYDIAQFYGHTRLETQAQKFLGVGKCDVAGWVDMSKRQQAGELSLADMESYLADNVELIGEYCRQDAELALRLALLMRDGFEQTGIGFKTPLSQAKLAETYLREHTLYPTVPKSIEPFHAVAHKAYHGGIFETMQRGIFDGGLYDYDINSAYPATMRTLPHWGNGEFSEIEEPNGGEYGWYMCRFDCPWIPFDDTRQGHTVTFEYPRGTIDLTLNTKRVLYPVGERVQIVTKREYDFMKAHKYPCEFLIGVQWNQTGSDYQTPFFWVDEMYRERRRIKKADPDDMRQYALKIMLNSAYGKTAQLKHGLGVLSNFFYASYITADTRIKLAEIAERYRGHVIDIATDGILLDCEVPDLPVSSALGDWELSVFDRGLFVGSGIRQLWQGDDFITYARGITENRKWDMLAELENQADSDTLTVGKYRPLNLGETLLHHKVLDWDDLNRFCYVAKKLQVNTDKKHVWDRQYANFGELLDRRSVGRPLQIVDGAIA